VDRRFGDPRVFLPRKVNVEKEKSKKREKGRRRKGNEELTAPKGVAPPFLWEARGKPWEERGPRVTSEKKVKGPSVKVRGKWHYEVKDRDPRGRKNRNLVGSDKSEKHETRETCGEKFCLRLLKGKIGNSREGGSCEGVDEFGGALRVTG